jgi:hypothetical protein
MATASVAGDAIDVERGNRWPKTMAIVYFSGHSRQPGFAYCGRLMQQWIFRLR